jgi:D-alanyl-D-alanine endopeptidase (penicillin-binding protein 7)
MRKRQEKRQEVGISSWLRAGVVIAVIMSPLAAPAAPAAPQLRSAAALVVDQDTGEVLFSKNPDAVQPIASITKLMTAIITLEAKLDPEQTLEIDASDRQATRGQSHLLPGTQLTRRQALQLALMASENRAARLLGRSYPGGLEAAIAAMNAKAQRLGMNDSHFADPTGLSQENRSTPADLVRLVEAAYQYPEIREDSVSNEMTLGTGRHSLKFVNTNRLTRRADWEIGLQKTGYIAAAGRCLVMQAVIAKRRVVMVFLDSYGKYSRLGDANRIRAWLLAQAGTARVS